MDKPLVRYKEGIGCALPAPAWETYGLCAPLNGSLLLTAKREILCLKTTAQATLSTPGVGACRGMLSSSAIALRMATATPLPSSAS